MKEKAKSIINHYFSIIYKRINSNDPASAYKAAIDCALDYTNKMIEIYQHILPEVKDEYILTREEIIKIRQNGTLST